MLAFLCRLLVVEIEPALLHRIKVLLAWRHLAVRVSHAVGKGLGLLVAGRILLDNLLCSLGGGRWFGVAGAKHSVHSAVTQCRSGTQRHT